ncbi:MAG: type II toxin-antitoxin system Phd/YefM family antitoxin [Sphingomonadaceae bacterium]
MTETLTVTATEANRNFSKLLRQVGEGKRVCVTSHGQIVATIAAPDDKDTERARRVAAVEVLRKRWASQPHVTIGPWTSEELYERD